MHNSIRVFIVTAVLMAGSLTQTSAQQRRSAGGEGLPPRPTVASHPRYPFVGTWVGMLSFHETRPIMFEFTNEDGKYVGLTVHPNNGTAPHRNTQLKDEQLSWEMPNSGGGVWYYTAKRVTPDSITGTVELRDHELAGKGTFSVIRRAAAGAR